MTLNAEAKVTEDNGSEQGPNQFETGLDRDEVANMAKLVAELAKEWSDRTFAVKILRGLCALTLESPDRLEPAPDSRHWGFTVLEIGEALDRLGIGGAQLLGSDAQQSMKRNWRKLMELWEREAPTIAQRLSARKVSLRPTLFREIGGGSGNPSRFGFRFLRCEGVANQQIPSINWLDVPDISYRQADISGNRLIRWLSDRGLYLSGRTGKAYLSVTYALFVAGVFVLWLLFVALTHAPTTLDFLKIFVSGAVILTVGYFFFGWQARLVTNRITLAPVLLQPFASSRNDYLLELRPDQETERNSLYMVRYVGDCPICGVKGHDKVHIEPGRREFFGRLVGRCNRAPNEHVFSFDHVTRQGRFLR
ncbi:hypothetical protein CKO36_17725 [Rhabdochromatium marinum]|nr:hypothetical protein [Rhabdochromatium marinum]